MVKLEAVNAEYGDCLIVHYEIAPGKPQYWLIDGGPTRTYKATLRDRLNALGGDTPEGLAIRLCVVTHIDDDHIDGIGGLLKAIRANPRPAKTPDVRFTDFWFNGFEETFGGGTAGSGASGAHVAALASGGNLATALAGLAPEDARQAAAFLQGVSDGVALMGDLKGMKSTTGGVLMLNAQFPGTPPKAVARPKAIKLASGVEVVVLAPSQEALDNLKQEWAKETGTSAKLQKVLGKKIDNAVANLSSIVMLATIHGKTMLLTGDGLADAIVKGWRDHIKQPEGTLTPVPIDIMKVPHHGSDTNNSLELFTLFPARHYVFCANGKNDNPDMATLKGLFKARDGGEFTLHMTYEAGNPGTATQTALINKTVAESGGRIRALFRTPGAPSITVTP